MKGQTIASMSTSFACRHQASQCVLTWIL